MRCAAAPCSEDSGGGRRRYCSQRCSNRARNRRYRAAHPEKCLAYERRFYEATREERRSAARRNRAANLDHYKEVVRTWDRKNRARHRLTSRVKGYGITVAEYEALLARSGGKCENEKCQHDGNRKLHIDHDHTTGRVRGLLCRGCNVGLGHLGDDLEVLSGLVEYLRAARGVEIREAA